MHISRPAKPHPLEMCKHTCCFYECITTCNISGWNLNWFFRYCSLKNPFWLVYWFSNSEKQTFHRIFPPIFAERFWHFFDFLGSLKQLLVFQNQAFSIFILYQLSSFKQKIKPDEPFLRSYIGNGRTEPNSKETPLARVCNYYRKWSTSTWKQ